ncbi:MAG: methyltransferase domain-containing protein [Anaerolineae bacterium]|nr:methyltransferase domain-containing protein [Anaerolineae bacterium]MDQ7036960.1 methyltransferase domain-containing protein [Anaerolineae bacterium]
MIFACPVCHEALLLRDARHFACVNGHHFDRAKEGYVNLLLANQKKSSDPGDSKTMIQARRLFLNGGYYQPLIAAISQLLPDFSNDGAILDVGCGEGYYIGQVECSQRYGIDISKIAIRYAAKGYRNVEFAVGSAMNLPILDNSVDIMLSIFAPLDIAEAVRVIKKDGLLVKVRPNSNHLFELKQLLYDTPQTHDISALLSDMSDRLRGIHSEAVTYTLQIANIEHIQALLQMTPYYWHATSVQQNQVSKLEELQVTADFRIDIYRLA